ncbi:M23 family metallopeptidase [Paraliobacillus salinarum]|uniref:M23 family metallopeptidase n=1 Tax=Paraliobacillus salinarum TaxID=1158996 RepID=UPI0015F71C7A|nr:M23 family metallopeptidase [Paraliobacillus salinarum]
MSKKIILIFCIIFPYFISQAIANEKEPEENTDRLAIFKKMEALTHVPWYYLAAIDQYESNIKKEKDESRLISIDISEPLWFGVTNPDHLTQTEIIQISDGIGLDGNGDGLAEITNDEDVLYSMAHWITNYGIAEQDIKIALWNYYNRALSVKSIEQIATVYKTFDTINLEESDFPIPFQYNYTYRSTWGDARGFGGRRIHEGTDIFASYGTPVKASRYGVVEIVGWNRFGGWRIGIRDIYNTYHYYAHLNGFTEGLSVGDVIKPGDVIGSVGSSGYGPPGTSGKFPPHLHYGMYKDNGYSEWSFDPYPYLKRWERQAKSK